MATPKELRDARKSLENMPAISDDADHYEPQDRGASATRHVDESTPPASLPAGNPRADEARDEDDPPIDLTMP